jgi:protein involved in polysaccharide export with SLBB domain
MNAIETSEFLGDTLRIAAILVCTALFLWASPGVAEQPKPSQELVGADQLQAVLSGPYTIQVGDVLDITFFKTEELDRQVTVGPDGEVYLPLVGRIKVVGRTVDDITAEITEGYRKEMINPQITLSVAEFSGLEVYVSGEVVIPGTQPYRGGLTLLQAISAAGGFNQRARRKEVLLIRPGPDNQPLGTIVDVKQIQRKGALSNDIPLAPLDIIYVHHKKIVNVNIFMQQYLSDNLPRFGAWMWYLPGYGQTN